MSPEQEDEHEDEWEQEAEYAPRSILAAGWFRAVLVLGALAIVAVVALPYLLNWLEPAPAGVGVAGSRHVAEPPVSDSAGSPPAPAVSTTLAPPAPLAPALPSATPERAPTSHLTAPPSVAPAPSGSRAVRMAAVTPKPTIASKPDGGRYWVQLGVFKEAANAQRLAQKVRTQGVSVEVVAVTRLGTSGMSAGAYHLVRAGGYRDEPRALAVRDSLRKQGYRGFVTEGTAQ